MDLGPKAGEQGGEMMFAGTYDELLKDENSLTAAYLSQRKSIPIPARQRKPLLQRSTQDHRRLGEQSKKHRRGDSARHVGVHHRRLRLGKIESGRRSAVRAI